MSDFYIGLDLGQSSDYTALTVLERVQVSTGERWGWGGEKKVSHYHCRHIERFTLGTSYPAIVARVKTLANTPPLGDCLVIVDKTGVGAPVCDLLAYAGIRTVPITITSGNSAAYERGEYSVPKRDLVSNLQVLLQAGRLKFADGLPEVQTLIKELLAFQVKVTLAANDVYGAWREGQHDDLVLSVALAAWYVETTSGGFGVVLFDD